MTPEERSMDQNRREFLRRLAAGAVYVGPTIVSLAAPSALIAQGMSSQHHHHMSAAAPTGTTQDNNLPPAPGDATPAPGKVPPPGSEKFR